MKILVAGRSGQLAKCLVERGLSSANTVTAMGRPKLDVTDQETIASALGSLRPDLVINAAAYTAVDEAEKERETVFALNANGAGCLAAQTAARNIPIMHMSTDYVFDGSRSGLYAETAPIAPLGVYGASKHAGELAVAKANPQHLIFRTAWVYSPFGNNFVRTMLRLAGERDQISVVDDQVGSPTSAFDIADGLLAVAAHIAEARQSVPWGVYHMAGGGGAASWADLAEAVFTESRKRGGPSATVRRITTDEYPTPARRPANSTLDTTKLADAFGLRLPDWQDSVCACVARLIETASEES